MYFHSISVSSPTSRPDFGKLSACDIATLLEGSVYELVPKNSIVVQKYGGTSVGSVERIQKIADRVARQVNQGWKRIAIVVSAMSGETNRLVSLMEQVNPHSKSKSYDMALAAGEQVSVGLTAAALEAKGLKAEPLLGYQLGIMTDPSHSRAKIQAIRTERIEKCWERGEIPVIAGFQGITNDLAITTLGRGGSDTSAVALAVALKASFCEINTDVHGVYTADPRTVPNARLIEKLEYDVALELAALGGKVLHSRCVELGAKYKMPIVVRDSFAHEGSKRTLIMEFNEKDALESPVVSGVTLDRDTTKVTIRNWKVENGSILEIFSLAGKKGVNVDVIVYDQQETNGSMSIGFTVPKGDLKLVEEAFTELKRQRPQIELESRAGLAKVSAVGLGMRSHSGVASKLFETLRANGIEILMITTSEIKISVLVEDAQGNRVTQLIHEAFLNS